MHEPTERARPQDEGNAAPEVPLDAPEADVLEQERSWGGEEAAPPPAIPPDAPEADVLEQARPADLEEDDREA